MNRDRSSKLSKIFFTAILLFTIKHRLISIVISAASTSERSETEIADGYASEYIGVFEDLYRKFMKGEFNQSERHFQYCSKSEEDEPLSQESYKEKEDDSIDSDEKSHENSDENSDEYSDDSWHSDYGTYVPKARTPSAFENYAKAMEDVIKENIFSDDVKIFCEIFSLNPEDLWLFNSLILEFDNFEKDCTFKEVHLHEKKYLLDKSTELNHKYARFIGAYDYEEKNYLIKETKCSKKKSTLFIPEIAFFEHRHIARTYSMLFNWDLFRLKYTIMQRYVEDCIEENKTMHDDLIYNSLRKVHRIAMAIRYLNDVHGRVHGNLSKSNIIDVNENQATVCKLIDFGASFEVDEDEGVRCKNKEYDYRYASPEENVKNREDAVFYRKSEVWSLGAILLDYCGIYILPKSPDPFPDKWLEGCNKGCKKDCCQLSKCNFCRVEDIINVLMVKNVESRPNINHCIEILYNKIIMEERLHRSFYEETENVEELKKLEIAEIMTKNERIAYTEEIANYENNKKSMNVIKMKINEYVLGKVGCRNTQRESARKKEAAIEAQQRASGLYFPTYTFTRG